MRLNAGRDETEGPQHPESTAPPRRHALVLGALAVTAGLQACVTPPAPAEVYGDQALASSTALKLDTTITDLVRSYVPR